MEFSQSVLSVYLSQPTTTPDLVHNVSWGGNENHDTTDNDENHENEGTDDNQENAKDNTEDEGRQPSEKTATIFNANPEPSGHEAVTMEDKKQDEEDQSDTEEDNREYYVTIIDGVRYLQYRTIDNITQPVLTSDDARSSNTTSPIEEKEETLTEKDNHPRHHPETPLPTIEPLPYSDESEFTGIPMTASMTPNEEQGSSSVEPNWGRTRQKTSQELADEWQAWETTNQKKTQEEVTSEWEVWSTPTYRHDRCHMCRKPVSTALLASDSELLCLECTPNVIEDNAVGKSTSKNGDGRRERDEEEEWRRIPIPQSDDSYSTEEWLSDESEQEETTSTTKRERHEDNKKEYLNCYLAFMLGPRKDGRILNKDGTILDVNDSLTDNADQQEDTHNAELPRKYVPSSLDKAPYGFPTRSAKKRIQGKKAKDNDQGNATGSQPTHEGNNSSCHKAR
jgi:hypothetical protein